MNHIQCYLRNVGGDRVITWIPEEFAVVGNKIDTKGHGNWSYNWTVERTAAKLPSLTVLGSIANFRECRSASEGDVA